MFDVPVDGWYAWLGLAAVSLLLLGTALALPTAPPPSAERAAATVDRVAASGHDASATLPLDAEAVRLGPRRIALRSNAGTGHATLAYGPATPVTPESPLAAVLDGAPPSSQFGSRASFARAAASARNRTPAWRPAGDEFRVRHVAWRGVEVTLVGA
ncbi:MAG: hypothetical protein ABEJ74_07140 [Haloferacaceae archaeon]